MLNGTANVCLALVLVVSMLFAPGCESDSERVDREKAAVFAKFEIATPPWEWARSPEPVPAQPFDRPFSELQQIISIGQPPKNREERDRLVQILNDFARSSGGSLTVLRGGNFSLTEGSPEVGVQWSAWFHSCKQHAEQGADCELLTALSDAHFRLGWALLESAKRPHIDVVVVSMATQLSMLAYIRAIDSRKAALACKGDSSSESEATMNWFYPESDRLCRAINKLMYDH